MLAEYKKKMLAECGFRKTTINGEICVNRDYCDYILIARNLHQF